MPDAMFSDLRADAGCHGAGQDIGQVRERAGKTASPGVQVPAARPTPRMGRVLHKLAHLVLPSTPTLGSAS